MPPPHDKYAAAIERELTSAIPKDGPQAHLYKLVADYPARGGRRMRPLLCLLACGAAGRDFRDAVHAAVALELLHNAFLVHDDIADASQLRRGAPTLHRRFGLPLALNAGDGLFALALERVATAAGHQPRLSREILAEFAHLLRRTVEGQAVELGWCADDRWDVSDDQYLAMVRDKTAWYSFIHPLRIGTLIGSGRIDDEAFVTLGFLLGAVFQIHDDLDNLLCDPIQYDKDLGCDLMEAKRTLPILHVLRHGSPSELAEVRHQLGQRGGETRERLAALIPILHTHGSIEHAQAVADELAKAATIEFRKVFADRPANPELLRLIELVEQLLFRSPYSPRAENVSQAARSPV